MVPPCANTARLCHAGSVSNVSIAALIRVVKVVVALATEKARILLLGTPMGKRNIRIEIVTAGRFTFDRSYFLKLGKDADLDRAIAKHRLAGLARPRQTRADRFVDVYTGKQRCHGLRLGTPTLIEIHKIRIFDPGAIVVEVIDRAVAKQVKAPPLAPSIAVRCVIGQCRASCR